MAARGVGLQHAGHDDRGRGGAGQGVPGEVRRRPRAQLRIGLDGGDARPAPSATTTSIDPYSTRDFYALAAFFADLKQTGVGTPKPTLRVPTARQEAELARLRSRIAKLQAARANDRARRSESGRRARRGPGRAGRLERQVRSTVVSMLGAAARHPRPARGDWMDESGEVVEPAVPRSLKPLDGRRPPRHAARPGPLAGRAGASRRRPASSSTGSGSCSSAPAWSDTLDDLGSQGEWPTPPRAARLAGGRVPRTRLGRQARWSG